MGNLKFNYDPYEPYEPNGSVVWFDELGIHLKKQNKKAKILPSRYIEGVKKKTGEKTITLIWEDDTRTNVVCSKNDKYDKRLGFLIAYFQYNSGLSKTQANKYLDNLIEEDKKGSK